jgi:hypothetical protein
VIAYSYADAVESPRYLGRIGIDYLTDEYFITDGTY